MGVNLALAALLYLTESGRWQVNLLLAFTMLVPVLMVDRINGRAGMGQVMPGSERVTATFQEERYIHVTQASESSYPYDRVQAVRVHGLLHSSAGRKLRAGLRQTGICAGDAHGLPGFYLPENRKAGAEHPIGGAYGICVSPERLRRPRPGQ